MREAHEKCQKTSNDISILQKTKQNKAKQNNAGGRDLCSHSSGRLPKTYPCTAMGVLCLGRGLGNGPLNQSQCSYFYLLAIALFFSTNNFLRIIFDWSFLVTHVIFTIQSLLPYSLLLKINELYLFRWWLLSMRIHFCFHLYYRILILYLFKSLLSQISLWLVLANKLSAL